MTTTRQTRRLTSPPPAVARRLVTYVRLSAAVIKQLDRMAQHEETTRSAVIRSLVIKALREIEEAADQKRAAA